MIGAASAADWLLPPGLRNALNQPVNEAHPTDRPPGRLTTTLREAGHDPAVLCTLEPNHCSTTRDSDARVPPTTARAHSILTSPDKDRNEAPCTGSGYPRPLPQRTRPGPTDRV